MFFSGKMVKKLSGIYLQNKIFFCYLVCKYILHIQLQFFNIQLVVRTHRYAWKGGVPRIHVPVHGDHGGGRLVSHPGGLRKVYGSKD